MTDTRLLQRSPIEWKPDDEQKMGVKRLVDNAVQALLLDPGAGKTSMTLKAFTTLQKRGVARKALVIAPLRPCYLVWPAEVDKWQPFCHLTYTVLHGNDKEERLQDDVDLYIINPDGLEWLFGCETYTTPRGKKGVRLNLDRFMELGIDTLIIDELTKFADTSSQRFKMMDTVTQFFQRRWGLTGSPAANGLMKLFGQAKILDEGRTFGPYITQFRMNYFVQHPFKKFQWDLKTLEKNNFDGEKAIFDALRPIAYRVEMKSSGTPTGIPLRIEVELPSKARKLYDMIEEDLFALIDAPRKRDGHVPITAANAGVALGKCRQIASGAVYPDEGYDVKGFKAVTSSRPYVVIHDEKLNALGERLEELQGQPYLLGYEFQHDLDRILKKWPGTKYIGAGVDMVETKRIETAWNAGELTLLLGHPQSIGHGLNFQQASRHVGWFSQTWDYELYDQFIRRVMRRGNPYSKVYIDHFIARNTVDELIYQVAALGGKKNQGQSRLFEALRVEKRRRSSK
jgi:hypothetical protein